MTQLCPKELAPEIADSKGGTLLLNYKAARETYDDCVTRYKGLIEWAQKTVARCQKVQNSRKELE